MSRERELTFGERTAAALMKLGMWLSEGYILPHTDELIRASGVLGTITGLKRYQRVVEALSARYGERDAHLLLGFAALWSSCAYRSAGHVFASNLLRFRDDGALFPIDQDEVERLLELRHRAAMDRVRELLHGPEHARILALLERQYELKQGVAQGTTPDDAALRACNAALDRSNERCILSGVDLDPHAAPPLSPVAKDRVLRHRYEAARQAQRRSRLSAAPAA